MDSQQIRRKLSPLGLFAGICLCVALLPSCANSSDGDIEAYCDLVEENFEIGLDNSGIELKDLDALLDVSPKIIVKVVEKLRNSLADIAEIDELDQLFAATFDPDALIAQQTFEIFNADECGISAEAIAAALRINQQIIETELLDFLKENEVYAPWVEKIVVSLKFNASVVQGAEATFITPRETGDALNVCHAISLWMFGVKEVEGSILIFDSTREVVRRNASDTRCVKV